MANGNIQDGHRHTPTERPARFVDADGNPKPGFRRFRCRGCAAEWVVLPGQPFPPELRELLGSPARPHPEHPTCKTPP